MGAWEVFETGGFSEECQAFGVEEKSLYPLEEEQLLDQLQEGLLIKRQHQELAPLERTRVGPHS